MKKGMSLIEVTVAILISALFLFSFIRAVNQLFVVAFREVTYSRRETDPGRLMTHILSVGRKAESCNLNGSTTLECLVKIDPTGPQTKKVRFRPSGATVVFEEETGVGIWRYLIGYGAIENFVLCDDATMQAGVCGLFPAKINSQHSTNRAAVPGSPNTRFFRFRIVGRVSVGRNQQLPVDLQSAFFVRNPGTYPGVTQFPRGSL